MLSIHFIAPIFPLSINPIHLPTQYLICQFCPIETTPANKASHTHEHQATGKQSKGSKQQPNTQTQGQKQKRY